MVFRSVETRRFSLPGVGFMIQFDDSRKLEARFSYLFLAIFSSIIVISFFDVLLIETFKLQWMINTIQ